MSKKFKIILTNLKINQFFDVELKQLGNRRVYFLRYMCNPRKKILQYKFLLKCHGVFIALSKS